VRRCETVPGGISRCGAMQAVGGGTMRCEAGRGGVRWFEHGCMVPVSGCNAVSGGVRWIVIGCGVAGVRRIQSGGRRLEAMWDGVHLNRW
jgi:hypothetical protein